MKNQVFFEVNVSSYDERYSHRVYRPASLNKPKDNAVMFVTEGYVEKADELTHVHNCLVFWPELIAVPKQLSELHAVIPCENPHNEYCRFFRDNKITNLPKKETVNTVDGAWIAETATIGENTTIMPGAYVGGDCVIGRNVYIGCGTKLVGSVYVGDNVIIRENTTIGADGLTTDREIDGCAITMPHFGGVVIEDDVIIGANTVVARGAIDDTRICRGAKLDNSCFISHNVVVGEDTFVVGETIMFGSSSTGSRCMISGNSTIRNGVHIGSDSLVGMGSVVTKNVEEKAVVKGSPAK